MHVRAGRKAAGEALGANQVPHRPSTSHGARCARGGRECLHYSAIMFFEPMHEIRMEISVGSLQVLPRNIALKDGTE
jgi:hypothetical protein